MEFDDILATCIERLAAGQSVESCLERFPEEAAQLEPLLRLAAAVRAEEGPVLSDAGKSITIIPSSVGTKRLRWFPARPTALYCWWKLPPSGQHPGNGSGPGAGSPGPLWRVRR